MQTCPHCGAEIRIRELRYRGLFDSSRICPACDGCVTVDTGTKYRQALFILVLLIALLLTLLLYFLGAPWLVPALTSYAVAGFIFYRGNRRLFLVPCQKGGTREE